MKAKIPKWIDECPTFVGHPAYVLKQAAKVLELDAKELRKERMLPQAKAAMHYANALRSVAEGSTWVEAFQLQTSEKT